MAGAAAAAAAATGPAAAPRPRPPSPVIAEGSLSERSRAVAARSFPVDLFEGASADFAFGVAATQGRRAGMEDAHAVDLAVPTAAAPTAAAGPSTTTTTAATAASRRCSPAGSRQGRQTALFGVFDGHAGGEAAAFCAKHVVEEFGRAPALAAGDVGAALTETFLRLEAMMHSPDHQGELARLAGHHTHQQQQQQQQQQQHTQQQHQQQPLSMAAAPAGATVAAAASAAAAVAPASLPGRPAVTGAQAPAPAPYGVVAAADGAYLGPRAGCTACVAVARGGELFVANVGDSRCVACAAGGRAARLTRDHKPALARERERVTRAGLAVQDNRVRAPKSSLAMSRALGDAKYKDKALPPDRQAVSPVPEVSRLALRPGGNGGGGGGSEGGGSEAGGSGGGSEAGGGVEFLLLACDGLWDAVSDERAVAIARRLLRAGAPPGQAALALVDEALSADGVTPPSGDNVTVMVVVVGGFGGGGGGLDAATASAAAVAPDVLVA